jgi:hypothetical protein
MSAVAEGRAADGAANNNDGNDSSGQTDPQNSMQEEDFSLSPVTGLQEALRQAPEVGVLQSLIGPGNCLLDVLRSTEDITEASIEATVIFHREVVDAVAVKPNVDIELLLILRLYTVRVPIPFGKYIDRILNCPDRRRLESVAPFMRLMIKALYALEACGYGVVCEAFRRIRIIEGSALQSKYDNFERIFAPHSQATFAGFSGASNVWCDASTGEANSCSIFFHFLNARGVDISCVSAYPEDNELLFIPPSVYCVGCAIKQDGTLTVPLTYVQLDNSAYLSRAVATVSKQVTSNCLRLYPIHPVLFE